MRMFVSVALSMLAASSLAIAARGRESIQDSSGAPSMKSGRSAALPPPGFRGVFFNPKLAPVASPAAPQDALPYSSAWGGEPWLCSYPAYRSQVQAVLQELASVAGVNLVDIFVSIPYSLKNPAQAPKKGQALDEWANIQYLDNVAAFVDDCHAAGVSVGIDLASNMWIPYSVDTEHQLANSGKWPMPDETPWDESALWYREVITYIEGHAEHSDAIAMWGMNGNYELGSSEPVLWDNDGIPAIKQYNEKFIKEVWPVFMAAGKRPKAAPILLPIFSNNAYWMEQTPEKRLSAFTNLKKWLVDDLALSPDYWVMTTYPFCDPGPDGFYYLRRIVEILGKENASRMISTDLKGLGHEYEVQGSSIISVEGRSSVEILEWHFRKCAAYGFAGWWIWSYQDDPPPLTSGIRDMQGNWKLDLIPVIKEQASKKSH